MRSQIVGWETLGSNPSSVGRKFWGMQRASVLHAAVRLSLLCLLLAIPLKIAQAQAGGTVLYNFLGPTQSPPDGFQPDSRLTFDSLGNLYGTTSLGGKAYSGIDDFGGTVYELSPEPAGGCISGTNTGNGWCESVLYSFCSLANCADGEEPELAYVTLDKQGNLYGTAFYGGNSVGSTYCGSTGCGIVFELTPQPQGGCPGGTNPGNGWCETVLYNFQGGPTDGSGPTSGLVWDSAGNLYGTTVSGGNVQSGFVYELSPNGSGGWNEQVIYPVEVYYSGLAIDSSGSLYGYNVGDSDYVYKLSFSNGTWISITLHTFAYETKDGYFPNGAPAIDSAGNVYGATEQGGSESSGTVWKLTPVTKGKGAGTYKEKILHNFNFKKEGYSPIAGVTLDSFGNIYGTTGTGGPFGNYGMVFELAVSGTGYEYKVLQNFDGTDGSTPNANPILDSFGNLYGTTDGGGPAFSGNVYELNLSATATTTTLTSSPNPSTSGGAVTFTATVNSGAGTPTDGDTVSFMEGSTLLGTGSLSGGSASFTTSSLRTGTAKIDALYVGDFNFAASTSNTVKQVVTK
jgi:Bacterial Ig-like domain (group 3)